MSLRDEYGGSPTPHGATRHPPYPLFPSRHSTNEGREHQARRREQAPALRKGESPKLRGEGGGLGADEGVSRKRGTSFWGFPERGEGSPQDQKLLTISLYIFPLFPRSSKFLKWSKLAAAGERITTSPGFAAFFAAYTAFSKSGSFIISKSAGIP